MSNKNTKEPQIEELPNDDLDKVEGGIATRTPTNGLVDTSYSGSYEAVVKPQDKSTDIAG